MTEEVDNKEPGLSLARARQEKGLAMDEVAARLHLSAAQIQSLEENDFESLPEATYIKGYIKNYAKLLGLEPVVLVDAYIERVTPKKNDTIETVVINEQKSSVSDDSKVMYTIFGIVVFVIAIIGIWVGTQSNSDNVPVQAATTEQMPENLLGPRLEVQSDEVTEPGTELENDSDDTSFRSQEQEQPHEPQYPAAPKKPGTTTAVTSGTKTSPASSGVSEKKPSVPANNQITKKTESNVEKSEEIIENKRLDEIILFFEENSWVDVRDKNDKKLLYKTVDEGRVVSVKGIAPFKIFLGNANGVKLSYNGRQVNFDQYKRGLIARFTVGDQ